MKVNRAEFLTKLKRCKPGVEKLSARLEGSDCFIFKHKRLHSYNGYISVSIPIEYDFECVVSAEELMQIVSSFKGKDIEIELTDRELVITSGKAKASITLMPEAIYKQILAVIPETPQWLKVPECFVEALDDCYIRNMNVVSAQKVDGIFVDNSGVYSTDKVVINYSKLYEPIDRLWLTSKMVNELIKFPKLDFYTLDDSWVIFKSDEIIFACRRYIDDSYPISTLKQVISRHTTNKMRGDLTVEFREAVHNALIMGDVKEERLFINLEFQNDGIRVFSGKNKGAYSEFVECNVQEWEHLTISVDGSRLKQALKKYPTAEFHIGYMDDKENALILHKGGWTEFFMIYKE